MSRRRLPNPGPLRSEDRNPRALGTNPRARTANPRALLANPRALRAMLAAARGELDSPDIERFRRAGAYASRRLALEQLERRRRERDEWNWSAWAFEQ